MDFEKILDLVKKKKKKIIWSGFDGVGREEKSVGFRWRNTSCLHEPQSVVASHRHVGGPAKFEAAIGVEQIWGRRKMMSLVWGCTTAPEK